MAAFMSRKGHGRLIVLGAAVLLILLIGIVGPWIAPYDPNATEASLRLMPPNARNWLGTDEFGRDILSRTLHGARLTLAVSVGAAAIGVTMGTALGVIAGYFQRTLGTFIMRGIDLVLSFPGMLLAITATTFLGAAVRNLTLIIGFLAIPRIARVVHPVVLGAKELEYVESARAIGARSWRIIRSAILPNLRGVLLVQAALSLSLAIIIECGLSFLGLGPPPPEVSWGRQIRGSFGYMHLSVHPVLWPSIAVTLTVLVFNTVGDALRDWFDVRLAAGASAKTEA